MSCAFDEFAESVATSTRSRIRYVLAGGSFTRRNVYRGNFYVGQMNESTRTQTTILQIAPVGDFRVCMNE